MGNMITLAIPEAPPGRAPGVAAGAPVPRARHTGPGIRLGVLDNSKSNAELLLKGLVERFKASAPPALANSITSVLFLSKPNAAIHAPPEILDQLAAGADVVISACGD